LLHWLWVNGSTHMNRFLPSTHQRLAGDCIDRPQLPFDKSSVWPDGKSKQAYPALAARAQPTVPHSWFRLDMTKNKILAQFHNYFVPEKVQCGVVKSLLKNKLWWPLKNSERLLSEIFTINFVARHWKYLCYIHCGRFKLQPRKQQGILHFVARNNGSFQKRKTLEMELKQVPIFKFTTICKKEYVQICWQCQDELKTGKENLSGNMLKNAWDLALLQLHVVNSRRGSYV